MAAYYNEWDADAAQWLRELIKAGIIPPGDIDERSITDVRTDDIRGYDQGHFFAGVGGWPIALRLAGWPDARPVWTGSCPCQPFSSAGKQTRQRDERHLWPDWYRLIRESKPATIFGEQVDDAVAAGWVDDVFSDLEAEAYACASAILPACSVEAPHERQRFWFVAHAAGNDDHRDAGKLSRTHEQAKGKRQEKFRSEFSGASIVDNAQRARLEGYAGHGEGSHGRQDSLRPVAAPDTYRNMRWIECPDGKTRPVKPGIRLLAHGIHAGASLLRGYGNAIHPEIAAEFVKAAMEAVA